MLVAVLASAKPPMAPQEKHSHAIRMIRGELVSPEVVTAILLLNTITIVGMSYSYRSDGSSVDGRTSRKSDRHAAEPTPPPTRMRNQRRSRGYRYRRYNKKRPFLGELQYPDMTLAKQGRCGKVMYERGGSRMRCLGVTYVCTGSSTDARPY